VAFWLRRIYVPTRLNALKCNPEQNSVLFSSSNLIRRCFLLYRDLVHVRLRRVGLNRSKSRIMLFSRDLIRVNSSIAVCLGA
jgi:hypothetical protein